MLDDLQDDETINLHAVQLCRRGGHAIAWFGHRACELGWARLRLARPELASLRHHEQAVTRRGGRSAASPSALIWDKELGFRPVCLDLTADMRKMIQVALLPDELLHFYSPKIDCMCRRFL